MKIKISAIIMIIFGLTMTLHAMVIHNNIEEDNEVIKTESGIYNEDYLFLGDELNFSGEAEDVIFLGKSLVFNGVTRLGLIALGKNVNYSGVSGNGIVSGAMNILIDGTITGNSFVGCKSLKISDMGILQGNLFVGCAKFQMDGKINGNLYAGAGEIIINNEINGDVTLYAGRIIIGEYGKINGNLKYGSKEPLSAQETARVSGTVTIDDKHNFENDWEKFSKTKKSSIGFLIGFIFLVSYAVIGCLLLFVPVFQKLETDQSQKAFWRTSLWGLIPVLMYPAIIVLCLILIVTIPFSLMLILAVLPVFFIANIIGTTLVGKYLIKKLNWRIQKRHYMFIIGALVGSIISMIPFIGFLYMLFTFSLGWGIYISFLFNNNFPYEN